MTLGPARKVIGETGDMAELLFTPEDQVAMAANDDLKTLPIAEVQSRLDSSPNGLTQAEAEKRLAKDGPNEISGKKGQRVPEVSQLFLGPDSLDD
jgi:hypothetical protein